MKLIILKTNIVEALNSVEKAVGNSNELPILKNILIKTENNQIVFLSTNLEIAIKHSIQGKIMEGGEVTVPFFVFNSIIKSLNSERVSLEKKEENLIITTENYEALIQGQSSQEFPIIPQIGRSKNKITVEKLDFLDSLRKTIVSTQYSEIRPEISGVFFNFNEKEAVLAATDGFRLAEKTIKNNNIDSDFESVSFILPLRTAQETLKIFDSTEGRIEIYIDNNQILFKENNQEIFSRLIDGSFPNYQAIIPKQVKTEVFVDKEEMLGALRVASVFVGRFNDVTLKGDADGRVIEVSSANSALGQNNYKIPAKIKGDGFLVTFNWKYLADGLKIFTDNEVFLGINHPDKKTIIKSLKDPFLFYILMPIKS